MDKHFEELLLEYVEAKDQIKRDERQLKELKKEWKRAQKDRRYYGNGRDNRDYRDNRNYRY